MASMDYLAEIRDVEDLLIPQLSLSIHERALYCYLFRHTRLADCDSAVFPLPVLARHTGMSESSVRKAIRSLRSKKCIVIDERSRQGHSVRVLLPSELGLSPVTVTPPMLDIESIDFFTGRNHVESLIAREDGKCFYCFRSVTTDNCVLDHVSPQLNGEDHSYRNVVATCHDCNSRKSGTEATDYLRLLYRDGLLSQTEFSQQTTRLVALRNGELVPEI
jgi:biotin operon repressor